MDFALNDEIFGIPRRPKRRPVETLFLDLSGDLPIGAIKSDPRENGIKNQQNSEGQVEPSDRAGCHTVLET